MIYFRNNLWSHVSRCSTESINGIILFTSKTETKINKFQLSVSVDQDILCLDVSVNNISFMKIKQSFSDNKNKLFCLSLCQSMFSFGKQIIVKRVSSSIFKDKVKLCLSFNNINKLCYSWV